MQNEFAERHVYQLSPVRRWLAWIIFGPFILGGLAAVIFVEPEGRVVCAVLTAAFALFGLGMNWLLSRSWLEVSPTGVRMHQLGYTVETPWTNVERLRMDRGQEAFVTTAAMEGEGPRRLSAARALGTYDGVAQELLYAQRYIPIGVFAWHLRHRLGEDLKCFVPHLRAALEAGPPPVAKQRMNWPVLAFMIAILSGFGILAFMAPKSFGMALNVCWGLLMPFIALQSGLSAVKAFRSKSILMGILSLLFALCMALLSLGIWGEIAKPPKVQHKPAQSPAKVKPRTS